MKILLKEGLDISNILGVVRYAPIPSQDLSAKGNLPFGIFKTDEESFGSMLEIPYGKTVDVTLKIDGSSCSTYCKLVEGVIVVGITSRSLDLKLDCENNYTRAINKYSILEKLKGYCLDHNVSLCLRGECYGNNLNASGVNPHCKLPLDFAAFNVLNLDTHEYESWEFCEKLCKELEIPVVPTLERQVILTEELIQKYREGMEKINDNHFEGVVLKGDRFSFKVISKTYDSKK